MDRPIETNEKTASKGSVGITETWWKTFNTNRSEAKPVKIHIDTLGDLPPTLLAAVTLVPKNHAGINGRIVNWRITCVSADGSAILNNAVEFENAELGGSNCAEDDMWAVPKGVNQKNEPRAKASTAFSTSGCIYVIDAGLCACNRCCRSLLGLAHFTQSTIILRPMVDYEIISSSRTALDPAILYLLVFSPLELSQGTFKLYNNFFGAAKDAEPAFARYVCTGKPQHHMMVEFDSKTTMNKAIVRSKISGFGSSVEYPIFVCPECKKKTKKSEKLFLDESGIKHLSTPCKATSLDTYVHKPD